MSKAIRMNSSEKNDLQLLRAFNGAGHVHDVLAAGFNELHLANMVDEVPAALEDNLDRQYYGYGLNKEEVKRVWANKARYRPLGTFSRLNDTHKYTVQLTNHFVYRNGANAGQVARNDYSGMSLSDGIFEKYWPNVEIDNQKLWEAGLSAWILKQIEDWESPTVQRYPPADRFKGLAAWINVSLKYGSYGSGLFSKRQSPNSPDHIVVRYPLTTDGNPKPRFVGKGSDYGRVAFMPLKFSRADVNMLNEIGDLVQKCVQAKTNIQQSGRNDRWRKQNLDGYKTSLKIFEDQLEEYKTILLGRGFDTVEDAIENEAQMMQEVKDYLDNVPHKDIVKTFGSISISMTDNAGQRYIQAKNSIEKYTKLIEKTENEIAAHDSELIDLEHKVALRKLEGWLKAKGLRTGGEEE